MAAFDWGSMMRVGMIQLRIPAKEFWQMIPAELMLLIQPDSASRPLGRSAFDALQAHFPDETGETDE